MSLQRPSAKILVVIALVATAIGLRLAGAQEGKALNERFRQLDKDGDERLSSQELPDKSIFARLDADSDGHVTLAEAKKAFASGVLTREEVEGRTPRKPEPDPISESTANKPLEIKQRANLLRPADHGVGRFVADLSFTDIHGKDGSLSSFKEKKLIVVAMTSTSCPLSRKYLPSLAELVQAYSEKGVQFVAVNCVPTDKPEDLQTAAKSLGDHAVYVHDADEKIAQHMGALTTTDVLVLDRARTIVYHGAIDDQYGIGYALDAPRNAFLAKALDSLLGGKPPEIAATEAPGCTLEPDSSATISDVTYHNRISRILQQNCIECHRNGGVGPFPLDTFADVTGHAAMVRQVVERGVMPPWFAAKIEGQHDLWANDRTLPDLDRSDLLTWLKSDRPEGDAADAPLPRVFADEWTIGTPDLVVQIPEPVNIKATGTMPYQFAITSTPLEEDKWIQGYEIIPTDRSVVHHVLVNLHEKGTDKVIDRGEGVGGYWAAYVPGNASRVYPQGFARRLPAGARMSFQIHYTPNGTETKDQLKIGLIFASGEPQYAVSTVSLADTELNIPPYAADHVESITRPIPSDVHVLAYMAHMHVRGKAFNFELTTPDGKTETLLDIPHYDFNWQLRYDYREPRVIPAGSRVKVTAVFDNSENNPANPDPKKTVHWGQQTYEEMMIGYVEIFAPVNEPSPTLRSRGNGSSLFTLLDTDGDEKLGREEVRKAADRVPRLKDNPQVLERLFDRSDADNDDHLSKDEFERLRQELGGRK